MNINDVLIGVLKKNDEMSEQILYRNEEENEVKHTLEIKASRDRLGEMTADIYIAHAYPGIANFLLPPPSPTPTQMISSSPSINQGLPFDITEYALLLTASIIFISLQ